MLKDIFYNLIETFLCYPWIKEKGYKTVYMDIKQKQSQMLKIMHIFKIGRNAVKILIVIIFQWWEDSWYIIHVASVTSPALASAQEVVTKWIIIKVLCAFLYFLQ